MTINKINNLSCTKCGNCCKSFSEINGVIITHKDIIAIANNLSIKESYFIETFCKKNECEIDNKPINIFTLKYKDNKCIFLNENNLCNIHHCKPVQCQLSPNLIFGKVKNNINLSVCKLHFIENDTGKEDIKFLKGILDADQLFRSLL